MGRRARPKDERGKEKIQEIPQGKQYSGMFRGNSRKSRQDRCFPQGEIARPLERRGGRFSETTEQPPEKGARRWSSCVPHACLSMLDGVLDHPGQDRRIDIGEGFDVQTPSSCPMLPQFLQQFVTLLEVRREVEDDRACTRRKCDERHVALAPAFILVRNGAKTDDARPPHLRCESGMFGEQGGYRGTIIALLSVLYLRQETLNALACFNCFVLCHSLILWCLV